MGRGKIVAVFGGLMILGCILFLGACEEDPDLPAQTEDVLSVSWSAPQDVVNEYVVYFGTQPDAAHTEVARVSTSKISMSSPQVSVSLATLAAFGVKPGAEICVKLQAVNFAGASALSDSVCTLY